MSSKNTIIPAEEIENSILIFRGYKVMLDADLAQLYGVETGNLNKAVKRNIERFPDDFMFQLTPDEAQSLRFQSGTLNTGRGKHRKYLPYVFTEQGVAMLSSVLRSKRAVAVNIEIMRAFVKLRRILETHKEFAQKLEEMEKKFDAQFRAVFAAIRELMSRTDKPPTLPPSQRRKIGF